MPRALVVVATMSFVVAASVAAQTRPNLTGRWTLDEGRTSFRKPPGAVIPPFVIVITQDDNTFVQKVGTEALTFRLDGSETINEMRGGGGMVQVSSRAAWEGDRLVLHFDAGSQGTRVQIVSVRADGAELIVEQQDGRKLIFVKS